jgi:hypothetical protein
VISKYPLMPVSKKAIDVPDQSAENKVFFLEFVET